MVGVTRLAHFLGCPGERKAQVKAAPLDYIPLFINGNSLLLREHRLTINNDTRAQQAPLKVGPLKFRLSICTYLSCGEMTCLTSIFTVDPRLRHVVPAMVIVSEKPDRVGTVHLSKPSCILPQEIERKHLLTSRWIVTVFLSGSHVINENLRRSLEDLFLDNRVRQAWDVSR